MLYGQLLSASSRDERKLFTMATIAPFYASEQTHCALVVCDSERVTAASHIVFWIFTEVATTLSSRYMFGATWNCCLFVARSVHTIQPCTILQYDFIRSVFSCNLPAAPSAEWPGCFTYYSGTHAAVRVSTERWPWRKKIIPLLLPGLEPATLRSRVRRSTTELPPLLDEEQWVSLCKRRLSSSELWQRPGPESDIVQSVSQPASQSASQPISRSTSQPISQSTSRPISQPIGQPASRPISQPISQSVSKPASQSVYNF